MTRFALLRLLALAGILWSAPVMAGDESSSLCDDSGTVFAYFNGVLTTECDGVLGTRSVQLGPETGAEPTDLLFEVIVEQDSETGEYLVRLAD